MVEPKGIFNVIIIIYKNSNYDVSTIDRFENTTISLRNNFGTRY